MSKWKFVLAGADKRFYDVGINADGTLHNPNGYPEDEVRQAISAAEQRMHQRRSESASRAAETRRRRRDKKFYEIVQGLRVGQKYGPRHCCVLCDRPLNDPLSIQRGIGSDCWQDVLSGIEHRIPEVAEHG